MNSPKEDFLLQKLDEAKRLVVALSVVEKEELNDFRNVEMQEPEQPCDWRGVESTGRVLCEKIHSNLLTALMVMMGYPLPNRGGYTLTSYTDFACWLSASEEEDVCQRWEEY